MNEGIASINETRYTANTSLNTERLAVFSRLSVAREEAQAAINKLYSPLKDQIYSGYRGNYGHGYGYAQEDAGYDANADHSDPLYVKDEIKRIIDEFDALIESEGIAWEEFVDATQDDFEAVANSEKIVLEDLAANELKEW